MVIINNKNIDSVVYLPKNLNENNGNYKLVLIDRGTNKEYEFENLYNSHIVQFDFYTFTINFSSLPKGEYEYVLFDDDDTIVSRGLIKLKELKQDNSIYNDNRTYIAYDR